MLCNTSIHPTTGFSHFYYLMYGRRARIPVDVAYGSPSSQYESVPRYVADMKSNLESAYQQAREKMGHELVLGSLSDSDGYRSYLEHATVHVTSRVL